MYVGEQISIEDAARVVHISMLMLCFLIVMIADLTASKSLKRNLTQRDITNLHKCHGALAFGLLIFWMSGAVLIDIQTGFDTSEFSAKLIAKLVVVTILTANAVVIGSLALPFYERNLDLTFGELTAPQRLRLASCAAISSASWLSAFCLGSIDSLKTAEAHTLIGLLATIYIAALTGAALIAAVTGRRKPRTKLNQTEVVFGTSRNLSRTSTMITSGLRA